MATDLRTLEAHFNALRIEVNLLLLALARHNPEVMRDWLAGLLQALDDSPGGPAWERELLQEEFVRFARHMDEIKKAH